MLTAHPVMEAAAVPILSPLDSDAAARGAQSGPSVPDSTSPEQFARECRAGLARARELLPVVVARQPGGSIEDTLDPYNDLLVAVERTS